MIYKKEYFETMNLGNRLAFSALRQALRLPEFQLFLEETANIDSETIEKSLSGCGRCWTALVESLGGKNIILVNNKLQELDEQGYLKHHVADYGTRGVFKNKEEAESYLSAIKVFNSITISYK